MTTPTNEHPAIDPAQTIRDIHLLGEEMGFTRVRIDRSAVLDDRGRQACYFEVGFGCGEITVRTSARDLQYRVPADRVVLDDVIELLATLLEREEIARV